MSTLNWQPVVDALGFALKAFTLVAVVSLLSAGTPDHTELVSSAVVAVVAGLVRHQGGKLPPWMRA